jgi:inosine/xanthosine triphosphatase
MMTIVVASSNPVKARAVEAGFRRAFPGEAFAVAPLVVDHGTRDQPSGDAETLWGARTRASLARAAAPSSDFAVGIEGGVEEIDDGLAAFAWVVVQTKGIEGRSRTGTFFLPDEVTKLVRTGAELGAACDEIYSVANAKQKGGAVGLLTNNVIDRTALYEHAVVLALIPFLEPRG